MPQDWVRRCAFASLAFVGATLGSPSWGGYVSNRTAWNDLSQPQKTGYAMAVVDSFTMQFVDDNPTDVAAKRGRAQCLADLKVTSADLASAIDEAYRREVARWADPPTAVLLQELTSMCRSHIEAEMAKVRPTPRAKPK